MGEARPATASSTENGGTPASAAVDGNTGTRWSSAFSDPQWLQVDLGATATISQVVLNWETAYAPDDLSAYWIPTLYENNVALEPSGVTVYYGSRLADPSKTLPFPQGFRMISGDAKKQVPTPAGTPNQFFCAGAGGEIGRSADGNWPVCAPTATLNYQLVFPDCWDGIHLDSPDHKSHVSSNLVDGKCGGAYPVAIPNISFVINYNTHGTTNGFLLASGMASSIHGDVFLAWDNNALGHRVKDCVVQKAKCNTAGTF